MMSESKSGYRDTLEEAKGMVLRAFSADPKTKEIFEFNDLVRKVVETSRGRIQDKEVDDAIIDLFVHAALTEVKIKATPVDKIGVTLTPAGRSMQANLLNRSVKNTWHQSLGEHLGMNSHR